MNDKAKNDKSKNDREIKSIDDLLETIKAEELDIIGGGTHVSSNLSVLALRPRPDASH